MVDLNARSAAHGLTPVTHGTCSLTEAPARTMTSLMPFQGQVQALTDALRKAYGVTFPAPGQCLTEGDTTIVWTGRGQAFLIGPAPDDALTPHAALTDQTDGWVTLDLTGDDARHVLARLIPVEFSPGAFPPEACARTQLQHAHILLHRIENGFRIRGFRSMARTIVHEIADAMAAVAARASVH
ncbi:sarcosine oxidase subunit gamma [Sagittula sp. S175]|uniref:sarcosine oxidase subunit gamma n=1 Tax=Sagittula sp. S175 TaxID=3415129 RepID=UPI003C7CEF88